MRFSVYYRIQNRYEYFNKFVKNMSKDMDLNEAKLLESKLEDLMEMIVQMVLDENREDLEILLTKQNGKTARMFFDYITCSATKKMKKSKIINVINELFEGEENNEII